MKILDLLFPRVCCLCMNRVSWDISICRECLHSLPQLFKPCLGCAIPLPQNNAICGKCVNNAYAFQHTLSPCLYKEPVDDLVHRLKFRGELALAAIMGRMITQTVSRYTRPLPETLIPVPLNPWRLAKRGFNQAHEIARVVSNELSIPMNLGCVGRPKATLAQSGLTARDRKKNLKGAFKIYDPCKDKHIAIIDDVMTTGNTVNDLAKTLIKSGVAVVEVWVFARAT